MGDGGKALAHVSDRSCSIFDLLFLWVRLGSVSLSIQQVGESAGVGSSPRLSAKVAQVSLKLEPQCVGTPVVLAG